MESLKLAVQKSGRLSEKSLDLLKRCGLKFDSYAGNLISPCRNFPIEFLFLRDDDIPEYVQEGIADLGIVGENVILEKEVKVDYLQRLGFGKCNLKIAIPNNSEIKELSDLNGKSIATSYPAIVGNFLLKNNIKADLKEISGSVEIAPNLGLSDAICDIVSTGSTLKSNGLKPFCDVISSEAVLIGKSGMGAHEAVQDLLVRIQSVMRAEGTKYVVLNIAESSLDKIIKILPGIKSPTVVPLAEKGWVAIHTLISEKDFWEKISQLKEAGAQGIVVLPTEKVII